MFMIILSIFFCITVFAGIIYIIKCKNNDNNFDFLGFGC